MKYIALFLLSAYLIATIPFISASECPGIENQIKYAFGVERCATTSLEHQEVWNKSVVLPKVDKKSYNTVYQGSLRKKIAFTVAIISALIAVISMVSYFIGTCISIQDPVNEIPGLDPQNEREASSMGSEYSDHEPVASDPNALRDALRTISLYTWLPSLTITVVALLIYQCIDD